MEKSKNCNTAMRAILIMRTVFLFARASAVVDCEVSEFFCRDRACGVPRVVKPCLRVGVTRVVHARRGGGFFFGVVH